MGPTAAGGQPEETIKLALEYAKKGWPVFPLHAVEIVDGAPKCTCSKGKKCNSPGKHPRTQHGLKDATTDASIIQRWFNEWPSSNVAIRTGRVDSGVHLVVIDIDVDRHGDETIEALSDVHGKLPDTLTVLTGGGGLHYYFESHRSVKNSVDLLGQGIDTRGRGGYVVAPPSNHKSGNNYQWDLGGGTKPATLPTWLEPVGSTPHSTITGGQEGKVVSIDFASGGRNNYLTSEGGKLARKGYSAKTIYAALMGLNQSNCTPPLEDREVKKLAYSVAKYAPSAAEKATGEKPDWWSQLMVSSQGVIKKSPGNATVLLCNREEWNGVLGYDAFSDIMWWLKDAPSGGGPGRPMAGQHLVESDYGYVQHWLALNTGPDFALGAVTQAVDVAAKVNTTHPVREYLESLIWDEVPRLSDWLTTYLGTTPTEYSQLVGAWWMISAVARVFRPGCQADHVLVLEGPQGIGKSTAARILAGEWYLGALPDLRGKDAGHALQGRWIVEVGELDAFKGAGATRVKDYITQVIDSYRPAYARLFVRRPRQCVFIATTNERHYIDDPTGGRRFWPVAAQRLQRDELLRDRDQLWAEAKAMFDKGVPWWPNTSHTHLLSLEQDKRSITDPWDEVVAKWVKDSDFVTAQSLMLHCLGFDISRIETKHYRRLGDLMHRIGWRVSRRKDAVTNARVRGYARIKSRGTAAAKRLGLSDSVPLKKKEPPLS